MKRQNYRKYSPPENFEELEDIFESQEQYIGLNDQLLNEEFIEAEAFDKRYKDYKIKMKSNMNIFSDSWQCNPY